MLNMQIIISALDSQCMLITREDGGDVKKVQRNTRLKVLSIKENALCGMEQAAIISTRFTHLAFIIKIYFA